jgi:hypothetical protein
LNFFRNSEGKWDITKLALVGLVVVLLLIGSWFAPKYKKTIEYGASEHASRLSAESKATTAISSALKANQQAEKFKNLSRKTWYENGAPKSETILGEGEKSSSVTMYESVTVTQSVTVTEAVTVESEKVRIETVEKRGGTGLSLLWGADLVPKEAEINHTIVGPVGVIGTARWDNGIELLAGPHLEF